MRYIILQRWRLFGHTSAAAVLKIFVTSITDMYLNLKERSALPSESIEQLVTTAEIYLIPYLLMTFDISERHGIGGTRNNLRRKGPSDLELQGCSAGMQRGLRRPRIPESRQDRGHKERERSLRHLRG